MGAESAKKVINRENTFSSAVKRTLRDMVDQLDPVPGADIANATASHTITDPADAPATPDALRDDLVANAIPEIEAALDALGAKINEILAAIN